MTREETKDAIRVMQAFADGKKIEIYSLTKKEWEYIETPRFNWGTFAYRIAPDQEEPKEKHYRPYTMEEFVEDMHKHDGFVRSKRDAAYGIIVISICGGGVTIADNGEFMYPRYSVLCRDFVWSDDGQPCGKEATE